MNARVESWIDTALARSPASWLAARVGRDRLAVLAYHDVSDVRRFAAQIGYLARTFHPVTLADVERSIAQGHGLPAGAVLVTFDDGDRSILEVGAAVLRRERVPAVAYVIAELMNGTRAPWFAEVRALVASGGSIDGAPGTSPEAVVRALKAMPNAARLGMLDRVTRTTAWPEPRPQLSGADLHALEDAGVAIGNHTMSHPCLPRCTNAEIEREVGDAHAALWAALGHPVTSFAYPNGDFDARADRVLRRLGYRTAFVCNHARSAVPPDDVLRIPRLRVNSYDTLDRFRIITSGLHPWLHRMRGGV